MGLMHTTITTTITTRIDLETFSPEHSVDINAEDGVLPNELIYAAALGGTEATARTIRDSNPRLGKSVQALVEELANEELTDTEFRQRVIGLLDSE